MPTTVVHIQHLGSQPLAVVRREAAQKDLARVIPESCGFVWSVLKAQRVRGGRHVAIYWDDAIRVDVGAEVDAPFTELSGVVRGETPSGDVAWTTHFGPYGGLATAHAAIRTWCLAHGWSPAGPRWEIYGHWNDAWNTNPSQIRTDVFHLVHRTETRG
jgi:effector-binding domain-containing protein